MGDANSLATAAHVTYNITTAASAQPAAMEKLTEFLELEAAHSRLQKNQNEEIESKRAPLVTSTRTRARFELVK
jgi:hypothetical protein